MIFVPEKWVTASPLELLASLRRTRVKFSRTIAQISYCNFGTTPRKGLCRGLIYQALWAP